MSLARRGYKAIHLAEVTLVVARLRTRGSVAAGELADDLERRVREVEAPRADGYLPSPKAIQYLAQPYYRGMLDEELKAVRRKSRTTSAARNLGLRNRESQ